MSTVVTGTSRDDWPDRPRTRRVSLPSNHDRWVGSSLARAMRRAQLTGIVLVQLVLLIAALVSTLAVPTITALLVAGVVVIAAFVVMLLRAHVWVLLVTYYLALGFYYVVAVESNDPLLGALIPLTAWTVILPVMLWPGVWPIIVSVLLATTYPTLLLLVHPGWDRSVLSASLITSGILIVNAVVFVSVLRRIADSLDQQNEAEIEEEAHAARQAASQHAAAEYVRVLHDTIVNTFGALARKQLHGTNATEIRLTRPGVSGDWIPWKDQSHGKTQQIPRRAA